MGLAAELTLLAPQLAQAAQAVYNAWEQDEEGDDPDLGSGGICDRVSEALQEVIDRAMPHVLFVDGGQDGDDHAFPIVLTETEACAVDMPPGVYERGGGYNWKKIPNVTIKASDITIFALDREDFYDVELGRMLSRVAVRICR